MSNGEKPLEPAWLWYGLSLIIPILGIILDAIYPGKPEPGNKRFGKNCIIATVASFVAAACCVVLYILFIFGIIGTSIFGAAIST